MQLYEHLYKPKAVSKNAQSNELLAFSDFIAHIAFLASLPSPTFNTLFQIEFLGKKLTIDEPMYDRIPDKNQDAIKVLFDVLDLRSILYCWKAILLGKTLILISHSTSL